MVMQVSWAEQFLILDSGAFPYEAHCSQQVQAIILFHHSAPAHNNSKKEGGLDLKQWIYLAT